MLTPYIKEAVEYRRAIHRRPEEGWTEFETMWLVCSHLKKWGIPYICGTKAVNPDFVMGRNEVLVKDAIARAIAHGVPQSFIDETEGYTGCFAIIDTGRAGPVTCFRFDMDALPVRESQDPNHAPARLGFASEIPGFMHACGHDAHTACGLALAHWLVDHKEQLSGKFKLLFQPAEEGVRGGRPMAESGQLDDVNWYVAGHVGGACHSNEVQVVTGGFMASSKFDIYFKGLEAHAGSHPHAGHSALSAAACATMMINGIPRHGEGDSRISVGKLIAGSGRNIVAADAMMQMEVRGITHEVNEFLAQNVQHIIEGVEKAYQVKARIERVGEATTLELCPVLYDKLEQTMHEVDGITVIPRGPGSSGSEDCSWQIRKIVEHGGQAGFFMYGCEHQGHHRPDFDIQDETNMPVALKVFINFAKKVNKPVA